MRAFSAHVGQGAASLYTKGSVVWPRFGAFDIWIHGFWRTMYICYVNLRHYHTRWWYWSKKRFFARSSMSLSLFSLKPFTKAIYSFCHCFLLHLPLQSHCPLVLGVTICCCSMVDNTGSPIPYP